MKLNKINKFIAILFGLTLILNSCTDDRLDVKPEIDNMLEGGIQTPEDLQKALNNAYANSATTTTFGTNMNVYGELISDNAFISSTNDGYFTGLSAMTWTDASGEPADIWAGLYRLVREANLVINTQLEPEYETTQEVREIKAQARILRGLAYYSLVQYFSPSPDLGLDSQYGIIINNVLYDPNTLLPRSTLAESFAAIIDDLTYGAANAPETGEGKYILTKTAANFLLAKVHLYMGGKDNKGGNSQLALEYANKVIFESPAAYGFINDEEEYIAYFTSADNVADQENKIETVWEIPQDVTFNLSVNAHLGAFYARTGQHRSILYRDSFKDSFATGDIRNALWDGQGPTSDEPRGNFIKKWQRTNSEGPFTQNIKVFRMTEAKFIRMEALAKTGQTSLALQELNAFSALRGSHTYTGNNILNDILKEKQIEFMGEGQRYNDLKRNSLPIIKTTNCVANCEVQPTDRLFVMPIPFAEINLNSLVVQNPGW
ncbi:MAG: RagB/SusD family nutrient uptake outer membrane protein [Weeksellaceae bacterium]